MAAYPYAQPLYMSDKPPVQEVHLSEGDSVMFAGFPDLLTVQHMELITGQSAKTIRKLCNDGSLPSVTIGERIYVPKARLIEYVAKGCGVMR